MNITVEDNQRIKVTMSAKELEENGISYAELDYDTETSRLFLQKLFLCSKSVTNFCKKGETLMIEIFPAVLGGCTVYFTPIGQIKQEKTAVKLNTPKICTLTARLESSDELLDFASSLKNMGILIKRSSLYKDGRGYILTLTPYSVDLNAVKALLNEYSAKMLPEKTVLSIKERYKAVCEEDAISKITKFL
ncbi:MAG: adaptor protein MecA [Clostridia bacterium]|nr:adaptor protein MecA [Clostridia bacterium]